MLEAVSNREAYPVESLLSPPLGRDCSDHLIEVVTRHILLLLNTVLDEVAGCFGPVWRGRLGGASPLLQHPASPRRLLGFPIVFIRNGPTGSHQCGTFALAI